MSDAWWWENPEWIPDYSRNVTEREHGLMNAVVQLRARVKELEAEREQLRGDRPGRIANYEKRIADLECALNGTGAESFDSAWAEKEAQGFIYGHDALEQVRFGWEIRGSVVSAKDKRIAELEAEVARLKAENAKTRCASEHKGSRCLGQNGHLSTHFGYAIDGSYLNW